jgi:hypothetical protein
VLFVVLFIILVSDINATKKTVYLINEKMKKIIILQGGEVIPDYIRICPHCGAENNRKKILFAGIATKIWTRNKKGGGMELLPLIVLILLVVYAIILFLLPIHVRAIRKDIEKIVRILEQATGQSDQTGQQDSTKPVRFDADGKPIYF